MILRLIVVIVVQLLIASPPRSATPLRRSRSLPLVAMQVESHRQRVFPVCVCTGGLQARGRQLAALHGHDGGHRSAAPDSQ